MRILAWLSVAVIAVAAAVGPARAGIFDSAWDEDMEAMDKCIDAVEADAAFAGVMPKLVRGGDAPTFAQLADDTVPSEPEAGALQAYATRNETCRAIYRKAVARDHGWMATIVERYYFQQDVVMIELVKRRISWGNGNKLRRESRLNYEQAWDAYAKAQSDAERRAIAESLEKIGDTIKNQPPPPGSGRVTCRWLGPTLICD